MNAILVCYSRSQNTGAGNTDPGLSDQTTVCGKIGFPLHPTVPNLVGTPDGAQGWSELQVSVVTHHDQGAETANEIGNTPTPPTSK